MSTLDLESFCTEWLAAWTGNDPGRLLGYYTEDAAYRDPGKPGGLHGHAELRPYFTALLAANPAWVWTAEEVIPTAAGFTLKWRARIPVGNATIDETGLDIVEMRGGKISRNEVYFDRAALLKALGAASSSRT
jgi:ketosteroid isomerase-like protein